jgi:thiol-disulfide isomerase/thioredoxin
MDNLIRDYNTKNPHKKLPVVQVGGEMELYTKRDKVVILGNSSITKTERGPTITGSFKGPGILEAYADWCPHCQDKADYIAELAKLLNTNGYHKKIYVLNVSNNADASTVLGVDSMPTFYLVDGKGVIGRPLHINSPNDINRHLGLN